MGVEVTATSGGSGGTPITTSLETQVTYDGVTWFFDTSVPVGRFEAGIKDGNGLYPPFVVSDRDFNITSVTPVSQSISGYQANGVMEDPYTTDSQGWDAMLQANTNGAGNTPTYSSVLNIDPGNTGSAISVSIGDNRSFVKTVRLSGATTTSWQMLDRYVTLTVLDAAPDQGAFMPSPSQTGSKTIFNINNLNSSALRSLTLPASLESVAASKAQVPADLGAYGHTGTKLRIMRLDIVTGASDKQYSAEISPDYARYLYQLHGSSISSADKQEMMEKTIQFGIQLYGLTTRGWGVIASRYNGAGQQGALAPWLYYAAFLLNSSTLLTAAQSTRTNMDGNTFWVSSADIGNAVRELSASKFRPGMTYRSEDLGKPWANPEDENYHPLSNYQEEGTTIACFETLAVEMLQNGPGGISGTQAILNGASLNDTSNQRAAVIAYMDRMRSWNYQIGLSVSEWTFADWKDMYDLVVNTTLARTKWTGKPDMLPYGNGASSGNYDDDMFTAGSGSISHTINGRDYSTTAVTRYDVRYSMDGGYQFKEIQNAGASGTTSGLLKNAQHYCQIRQVSADGGGPYSINIASDTRDPAVGVVTTGGTDGTVGPAVDVAPVVLYEQYPAWDSQRFWLEAPTAPTEIDADDIILAIGGGYWTGEPAPSLTYQWQRSDDGETGWADISTAKVRTRTADDAGKYLRGQVTATNASGTTTATTQAVKCPPIITLPAGTLIDTDFAGRSAIDYATELTASQAVSTGGTWYHDTDQGVDSLSSGSVSSGRVWVDKEAATVYLQLPFKERATANTTYSIAADVVGYAPESFEDVNGSYTVSILDGSGGALESWPFNPPGDGSLFDTVSFLYALDSTFYVPPGLAGNQLDLSIRVQCSNTSANGQGGSPMLCSLTVAAV